MDVRAPRPSVLSLFDPLSERSQSPDSDKENNVGEISFFHLRSNEKLAQTPVRQLRRRLIDVGDMTVEDHDIHDFLAAEEDELEAEINHSVTEEEDNDTLTFRDMAKAATPKWSGRKAATISTPMSPPTPRTPLAEIVLAEDMTPLGHKKAFKHPVMPTPSKLSEVATAPVVQEVSPSSIVDIITAPEISPLLATPAPSPEDSFETITTANASESSGITQSSLGSSVCTLELSTPSGNLLNDTAIPVFVSPSSPEPFREAPIIHSPSEGSRLRPSLLNSNNTNRYSIDLHTSFQLQLNSSDSTFDLLNDKISFFNASAGNNTLDVLEEGPSFGDDASFGIDLKVVQESMASLRAQPQQKPVSEVEAIHIVAEVVPDNMVTMSPIRDEGNLTLDKSPKSPRTEHGTGIPSLRRLSSSPRFSVEKRSPNTLSLKRAQVIPGTPESLKKIDGDIVSTPSPLSPVIPQAPPPVPALKIVKRSKTLLQPKSILARATSGPSGSKRTSIVTAEQNPTSRVPPRSSPDSTSPINLNDDLPRQSSMTRRVAPVPTFSSASQTGDGPRRVLASEGPKLNPTQRTQVKADQGKSTTASASGPRRVALAPEDTSTSGRSALPASSGLRQPVKYATVGPASASAIPKPVSRNTGSRLPAPSTSGIQRFGVLSGLVAPSKGKGLLSRRA